MEYKANRAAIYVGRLNMHNVEPEKISKFHSTRGRCFNSQEYMEAREKEEIESEKRREERYAERIEESRKYDEKLRLKDQKRDEERKQNLKEAQENAERWARYKAEQSKLMYDRVMAEEQRRKVE